MTYEERRYELQQRLDQGKTREERNRMGQFSTPYPLALDIMHYARSIVGDGVSMLEPSVGTGVFYSAFRECFGAEANAVGYEIDPYYLNPTATLWEGCNIELRNEDFLTARPMGERFSLLVANPPYSRHHHLSADTKAMLKRQVVKETAITPSGLSGLYCYFLMLSTKWLADGALSCWLIPSEFMDVNYGSAVKEYLTTRVDLLAIHRFAPDDVQFCDALVSSSIVVFRNQKPSGSDVRFTTGGSINVPKSERHVSRQRLSGCSKWSRLFGSDSPSECRSVLGDYFTVKRGIATGNNNFFIIDQSTIAKYDIPSQFLTPVLPAPRHLDRDEVESDGGGIPAIDNPLYLFNCALGENILRSQYPGVWQYIEEGRRDGVNLGSNCSKREPWYSCEVRKPSPILITYMGRNAESSHLFRFILNDSKAIATNSYLLLYPKPQYSMKLCNQSVRRKVWQALNAIPKDRLISCGRVYGGGLYKLEPRELMNTPIDTLDSLLGREQTLFDLVII